MNTSYTVREELKDGREERSCLRAFETSLMISWIIMKASLHRAQSTTKTNTTKIWRNFSGNTGLCTKKKKNTKSRWTGLCLILPECLTRGEENLVHSLRYLFCCHRLRASVRCREATPGPRDQHWSSGLSWSSVVHKYTTFSYCSTPTTRTVCTGSNNVQGKCHLETMGWKQVD